MLVPVYGSFHFGVSRGIIESRGPRNQTEIDGMVTREREKSTGDQPANEVNR